MDIKLLALNFELPAASSVNELPEWLLLVPAGHIQGRDGREWFSDSPDQVIAYNRSLDRDIVFDFEHSTALKAPQGEPAPASGWIKAAELEVRDGAIWGRVDWNEAGRTALNKEDYRYYSTAFLYDAEGRVTGLHHVALTNRHNLFELPALNSELTHPSEKDSSMKIALAIAVALGLNAETATETDVVTAIGTLKTQNEQLALNREQPNPEKFVPVATHELALNRANEAEGKLATAAKAQLTADSEALVDKAIKVDKKIHPADRDHYLALCAEEGGLERAKGIFERLHAVLPGESGLDGKQAGKDNVALNSEQQVMADAFGNSPEELKQHSS
jgi:phage I-like protein